MPLVLDAVFRGRLKRWETKCVCTRKVSQGKYQRKVRVGNREERELGNRWAIKWKWETLEQYDNGKGEEQKRRNEKETKVKTKSRDRKKYLRPPGCQHLE